MTVERSLRDRVLLFLAEQMGPAIDVLDIANEPQMSVRDIILHFGEATPPASPAEVRAALCDLHEPKHIFSCGLDADISGGGYGSTPRVSRAGSQVRLTCRGLVAARKLDAAIGRPVQRVTFVTRMGQPMLSARFDTGSKTRDQLLNSSGTAFAVTLVVSIVEPTEANPLFAADCVPYVERLRLQGLRQIPGPTRGAPISEEAISKALQNVGPLLQLKREHLPEDKRRECYFVTGPMPEFRISAGDRWHCPDWESYRRFCWHIINNEPVSYDPNAQRRLFPAGLELPKPRKRRRGSSEEGRPGRRIEDVPAPEPEAESEE